MSCESVERRAALVAALQEKGAIRSERVAAAVAAVPRHLFAPEASLAAAYADDIVVTKRDPRGAATSSVSAPWLQALMLEQAGIEPGMRCLEIGSGGYNAALMAELAGPDGCVTSIDIDADIVARARRHLAAAGTKRVRVVVGDAEAGVPEDAPFDRIVVTVGAWDVPPAWVAQLTMTGRIVVPLLLHGHTRTAAFDRAGDTLVSRSHELCGFVAMQGLGARPDRVVPLGPDVELRFDDNVPVEADGVRAALRGPRAERWSGITVDPQEPFDGLQLWLATQATSFGQLCSTRTDAARALVDPATPPRTPAVVDGGSLAYHALRRVDPATGRHEFGAYGHGPAAVPLAERMVELIQAWDREHRNGRPPVICVQPAGTPVDRLRPGRVLRKRHTVVTVDWR
ncbi:methyltransferase, FxLD system [Jiangella alkaliphila]|uniref:Protein-L-isoaspartate O-methyltransferase n=1 Tax=Jiangella alkaliphila TaxID=419479 RepID=A0A1H2I106_9ACTN|nr:methyltransferase, FxLD system [Jiangella alkaliphila]SDU37803.1 protein-L-isoaspartate(D-aspartate) O-methyltransferase [Jiangella alkaliphila]